MSIFYCISLGGGGGCFVCVSQPGCPLIITVLSIVTSCSKRCACQINRRTVVETLKLSKHPASFVSN